MTPAAAYITTEMLKDVLTYGTAKNLKKFSQGRPCAGKTGTTDDFRDAWFIGYTPRMVTGVWVGWDQPRTGGRGFTGGLVAAPIWERFMARALAGAPPDDFPRPDTVVAVGIDPATGGLAAEGDPNRREELFVLGTEPGRPPEAPTPAPTPALTPTPIPGPAPGAAPAPAGATR